MHCSDFERLLEGWLDGRLSQADRARCRRHLAGCAGCRGLVEPLSDAANDLPPTFLDAVLAATTGGVCSKAEERLVELVEGTLDAETRDLLASHLAGCSDCSDFADHLRYLDATLPLLAEIDPGPTFTARVLAECAPQPLPVPGRRSRWRRTWEAWLRRPRFAVEAAYALLLVCLLLFNALGSPLAALPVRALQAATGPRPWIDEMATAVEESGRSLLGQVAVAPPVSSLADSGDTLGRLARRLTQDLRATGGTLVEGFASLLETDEGGNELSPNEEQSSEEQSNEEPNGAIDSEGSAAEETP